MKIHRQANELTLNGMQRSGNFNFNITPETFEMFFKNIYKNPILACVRELSCNARDAHLEAKNTKTPFIIHAPNQLEPWFEIRDFGPGLSQEQVETLYTTFMQSSKQASDDFIGGLGIGSKSPLAYTDMFTVSSFYNGHKYIYIITKDQFGVPTWNFVVDEKTTEPNGLCINVPVKVDNRTDFHSFKESVQRTFAYMDVSPTIIGSDMVINKPVYSVKHPSWGMRETEVIDGISNLIAIMGGIPYPIDFSALRLDKQDTRKYEGILFSVNRWNEPLFHNIDIYFNIGELSITPSREELQYDERTVKAILNKFSSIQEEFVKDIKLKFSKCKTYLDACLVYCEQPYEAQRVIDNQQIVFKGKQVKSDINGYSIPQRIIEVEELNPATGKNEKVKRSSNMFNLSLISNTQMTTNNFNSKQYAIPSNYIANHNGFNLLVEAPIFIVKDERCGNIIPKVLPLLKDLHKNVIGITFPDTTTSKQVMKKHLDKFFKDLGFYGSSQLKIYFLSDLQEDVSLIRKKTNSNVGVTYKFTYIDVEGELGLNIIKGKDKLNCGDLLSKCRTFNKWHSFNEKDIELNSHKDKDLVYMEHRRYGQKYVFNQILDSNILFALYKLGINKIIFVPVQRMNKNIKESWKTVEEYLTKNSDKIIDIIKEFDKSGINNSLCYEKLYKKKLLLDTFKSNLNTLGVYNSNLNNVFQWFDSISGNFKDNSHTNNIQKLFIKRMESVPGIVDKIVNIGLNTISNSNINWDMFYKDNGVSNTIIDFLENRYGYIECLNDDFYMRTYSIDNFKDKKGVLQLIIDKLFD